MVNFWGLGCFLGEVGAGGELAVLFLFCFGFCGFWVFLGGNTGGNCVVSPDG